MLRLSSDVDVKERLASELPVGGLGCAPLSPLEDNKTSPRILRICNFSPDGARQRIGSPNDLGLKSRLSLKDNKCLDKCHNHSIILSLPQLGPSLDQLTMKPRQPFQRNLWKPLLRNLTTTRSSETYQSVKSIISIPSAFLKIEAQPRFAVL